MWRVKIFVLASVFATNASAQLAEQSKCWLGSRSFSPGATAYTGGRISVCTTEFTWEASDETASGCIAADEFYTVGAIENGPRSDSIKMECRADGIWHRLSE